MKKLNRLIFFCHPVRVTACLFGVAVFLVSVQFAACKKETNDKTIARNEATLTDDANDSDTFDYAAEEKQFAFDDTDEDNAEAGYYITEASTSFKITSVKASEILPTKNPITGKSQRYGKRNILSSVAKTRITIVGEGFRSQTAKSKVLARIKFDTIGFCDIISWDSTRIVADLPILQNTKNVDALNKTFSLKISVFRESDKTTVVETIRTKSAASLSDLLSVIAINGTNCEAISMFDYAKYFRRDSLHLSSVKKTAMPIFGDMTCSNQSPAYIPQVGDILFKKNGNVVENSVYAIVTDRINTCTATVLAKTFVRQSCTDPLRIPPFAQVNFYQYSNTIVPNSSSLLIKDPSTLSGVGTWEAINPRLNGQYFTHYMR